MAVLITINIWYSGLSQDKGCGKAGDAGASSGVGAARVSSKQAAPASGSPVGRTTENAPGPLLDVSPAVEDG